MTFSEGSKFRVASLLLLALSSVLTLRFTAVASSSSRGLNGTAGGTSHVRNLYVGAFFSFPKLFYQPVVAQVAIDHINSLHGILDGYHLEMRWNWTGVSPSSLPNSHNIIALTKYLNNPYSLSNTGSAGLIFETFTIYF